MATPYKIKLQDGDATNPAVTFNDDTNLGLYRVGADEIGFSAGGTLVASIDTVQLKAPSTDTALGTDVPGISFQGDEDTGLSLYVDDNIQVVAGGAAFMLFDGDADDNIVAYKDLLITNEKGLRLRDSTNHVDKLVNYGTLYTLDSDESLYYVNSSGATFVVNMTAV